MHLLGVHWSRTLTDETRLIAIRQLAERHTAANTATAAAARASLVRKGIYTQAGQLTPEYGGEAKPQSPRDSQR
jgi:DNA-binding transcriptional regulator YhcF (GntR family)